MPWVGRCEYIHEDSRGVILGLVYEMISQSPAMLQSLIFKPTTKLKIRGLKSVKLEYLQASTYFLTHRIHVWYIYLHLIDIYGTCRQIYHTWILWVMNLQICYIPSFPSLFFCRKVGVLRSSRLMFPMTHPCIYRIFTPHLVEQ